MMIFKKMQRDLPTSPVFSFDQKESYKYSGPSLGQFLTVTLYLRKHLK